MRLVGRRRVELVGSPLGELPDETAPEERPRSLLPKPIADLACVFDLDGERIPKAVEGAEVWLEAVGPIPENGSAPDWRAWYARAAGFCSIAVFLGRPDRSLAAADVAKETATKIGRPRPMIFVGTFRDDVDQELAGLAGKVDGLVIEPRPDPEPEIEAERLRRACSCLPERLLVDGGVWKYAPAVMATGKPDALAIIPQDVMEFALLFSEPARDKRITGKLLVCWDSEVGPWWGRDYFVLGPERIGWRPWARDPRRPRD